MKERVKTEIYETVENEVRKQCMRFVKKRSDEGPKVKERLLKFLREELADAVVDAARPAALRVLETNFRRVEKEIVAAVGRAANPIQQAVDSIVSEHETQLKRSDAQRRRHVLASGEAALAALPRELSVGERAP
jgi:precorrin-6x reductase